MLRDGSFTGVAEATREVPGKGATTSVGAGMSTDGAQDAIDRQPFGAQGNLHGAHGACPDDGAFATRAARGWSVARG